MFLNELFSHYLTEAFAHLSQSVVHPRRKHHGTVAQAGVRQGVGHLRRDALLASRAPVAMDRMFGRLRAEIFGNILDAPRIGLAKSFQTSLTVWTARKLMFLVMVDPLWPLPTTAQMPFFAAGPLVPRRNGRFFVNRDHARGRGGRCRCRIPRLGQWLGHFQDAKITASFPREKIASACARSRLGPKDIPLGNAEIAMSFCINHRHIQIPVFSQDQSQKTKLLPLFIYDILFLLFCKRAGEIICA